MASNNVLVTFQDLHAMAGRLNAEGAAIGQQLSRLLGEVSGLVAGGWRGDAAAAFESFYASANTNWAQVEQALAQMSSLMTNIANQYESQEAAIAGSLR